MNNKVTVSITICTCNRVEYLRQTLASLAGVCVPETMSVELIVVDNASTDDTAQVVKSWRLSNMPVRYIHEPRQGKGYAYNAGMAAANGKVFLFTDDDVRLPKNWIEGMCRPIIADKTDAIVGSVEIAQHLQREWMESTHQTWLASTHGMDAEKPDRIVGANMAFSRKVLEEVPSFDPELGPGALGFFDETLFSWQLKTAGFRIASAFDTCVEHHFDESRLTTASFIQAAIKMGRSQAYLAHHWKHETEDHVTSRLLQLQFRHAVSRFRRHRKYKHTGMWPGYELNMVSSIAYLKQYMIESKKPRKYDKHGLRKLSID